MLDSFGTTLHGPINAGLENLVCCRENPLRAPL
jgi:hypothetical protein